MTVLAFTAGLTDKFAFGFNRLADSFTISNLRIANITSNFKFPEQTVNDNIQMQLAHTGNNGLCGFRIRVYLKGRIFFRQFLKGNAHLFLVGFCLGFNRNGDNRLREYHGFQDNRGFFIAKGIAGRCKLQAYSRSNVPGVRFRNFFPVVGMHQQDTSHTFPFIFGRVINIGTGSDHTGIYPEESQFANKGVGSNFECQRRERFAVGSGAGIFLPGLRIDALDTFNISRSRHIIDYCVQQGLNPFILIRRTTEYRIQFAFNSLFADSSFQFFVSDFFAFQIFHHQVVVTFGNSFHQNAAIFFSLLFHFGRDFHKFFVLAHIVAVYNGLHTDQVNHALELIFASDRNLERNRVCVQAVTHHVHYMEEISADDIHFIDICHTRYFVFVSLTPYGFRLGFNTALGRKYCNRSVQNPQGTFNFYRKVNVARSINNVDTVGVVLLLGTFPHAGSCSGSNRNTTFLLLNHPVHSSGSVVDFTDFMGLTGIEQDTFRGGGLTGINMCHDTDISCSIKRN